MSFNNRALSIQQFVLLALIGQVNIAENHFINAMRDTWDLYNPDASIEDGNFFIAEMRKDWESQIKPILESSVSRCDWCGNKHAPEDLTSVSGLWNYCAPCVIESYS